MSQTPNLDKILRLSSKMPHGPDGKFVTPGTSGPRRPRHTNKNTPEQLAEMDKMIPTWRAQARAGAAKRAAKDAKAPAFTNAPRGGKPARKGLNSKKIADLGFEKEGSGDRFFSIDGVEHSWVGGSFPESAIAKLRKAGHKVKELKD